MDIYLRIYEKFNGGEIQMEIIVRFWDNCWILERDFYHGEPPTQIAVSDNFINGLIEEGDIIEPMCRF